MIVMIDNYDSFTYNLFQYLCEAGREVKVYRNDEITTQQVIDMDPAGIVISPGPGTPDEAGISMELILAAAGRIPVLGVCLGHQSIVQAFGGKIISAKSIMHGKESQVTHNGEDVYKGIRSPMKVIRYHSLAAEKESLPDCLEITSETDDGEIMGVRHKELSVQGVQYHPESILTTAGKRLLVNFLEICKEKENV